MDILYIRHVDSSTSVFSILTFSFLGICITYIYGTLLTANGSLRQLNIMAIIAVVINITLNLILIKRFGITGAAIANASTQLFTALYQFMMVKRIFHLKTDFLFLIRMTVFVMIISISGYLFSKLQIFWMYSFLIYIFFAFMLSFLLRLLKVKAFYEILYTEN
jgi:O-antigen/teichoic acid export membrane protein